MARIFIREKVLGTNKDEEHFQAGDPAVEEPDNAADSETPFDPDEEEHVELVADSVDFQRHVNGSLEAVAV